MEIALPAFTPVEESLFTGSPAISPAENWLSTATRDSTSGRSSTTAAPGPSRQSFPIPASTTLTTPNAGTPVRYRF